MFIKTRNEFEELKLLRCLNMRLNFADKEEYYYSNLEKGFNGESKFDAWLEKLSDEYLILNDLLFEINNTLFQIDTLIIAQETVYILEVKNYEGDHSIESNKWYTASRKEIKNPLNQLQRSETLFRQLLQELNSNFSIKAYLVFVNFNFYLYEANLNLPCIFPTQINRFIENLNRRPPRLAKKHSKLVDTLLSISLKESPYLRLPEYSYDQLEKGITCVSCNRFITKAADKVLICLNCGCKEGITSGVLRNIKEFNILFPDRKITINAIYEWCNRVVSKTILRRILSANFKLIWKGNASYYEIN